MKIILLLLDFTIVSVASMFIGVKLAELIRIKQTGPGTRPASRG